jgi:hypothetical protein
MKLIYLITDIASLRGTILVPNTSLLLPITSAKAHLSERQQLLEEQTLNKRSNHARTSM